MESYTDHLKIVVVGNGGVGKTCLINVFASNFYPDDYIPTIYDNYRSEVELEDNRVYRLQVWDTAGQDEYCQLRPIAYQNTHIFIVCFSLINWESLHDVRTKWIPEIRKFNSDAVIVLVGTKKDIRDHNWSISQSEKISNLDCKAISKELRVNAYIVCSAKECININNVFVNGVKAYLRDKAKHSRKTQPSWILSCIPCSCIRKLYKRIAKLV